MTSATRGIRKAYQFEWWIFAATALSAVLLIVFPFAMRGRTEGYLHPHGYCYLWDPALVSSHVASDAFIGGAYIWISLTLAYLVHRVRHLLPFHWMFLAFGLFILTCGATHFMDVWTLWKADFWASAALKIVTAVASVATAIALPPLVPQVVQLLQSANASEARLQQLVVERREREEAEAENRAKDLFLATLSHELRTPLNAIGGWVQLLQASRDADASTRRALEAIQRNVTLQTRLVEDMLDVSAILTDRLQLDMQQVDVAELVRQAVETMMPAAEQKGVRLHHAAAAQPLAVHGDPARLQQVVINLLSNALKFTPAGGDVHVSLGSDDRHVRLVVRDTGRGIDAAFLPHVFDPFAQADQSTTRAAGGLGLGLSIVQHLVHEHAGTVTAASAGEGRGATFEVTLPGVPLAPDVNSDDPHRAQL